MVQNRRLNNQPGHFRGHFTEFLRVKKESKWSKVSGLKTLRKKMFNKYFEQKRLKIIKTIVHIVLQ